MIQFLRFIPVQLTFFLIAGILIGSWFSFQPTHLMWILCCLNVLFIVAYIRCKKQFQPSIVFTILGFLIFFFIGVCSITYKNPLNNKLHYSNNSEFTTNNPISVLIKIQKVLKPTLYYNKYEAAVLQLNNKKVTGKILVNLKKDSIGEQLAVDNNLVVKTQFKNIKEPLNPYGFNYKEYLKNQQIHHQIQLNKKQLLILPNKQYTVSGIASSFRNIINKKLINNGFKNDELAVINALLLGQRNTISSDLLASYAGAGAVHILAVSGLHIGIILLLLIFVFKPFNYLKNGNFVAALLIIIVLWIYAVIAGLSASVVRAVTMFTALTIGMHLVQRSNIYNTLVISMFFLLLFNPFYLFEIGFQLSYLAVFSIVWIQPKLYSLWKPKLWALNKIWQLFTVSIAAQIGVLPLSLFYFHQFPGLFFLANLVIIPFLGFILIAGILIITLAIFDILPQFLGNSYTYIIQLMNDFVAWISNQEFFIIQNISFSFVLMLASYIFIFSAIKWIEKKFFYRFALMLISLVFIQFVVIFEKYKLQSAHEFIVFNKSKSSFVGNRVGDALIVYSTDSLDQNDYLLKSYLVGTGIHNEFHVENNKKLYKYKNEIILFVDSLGFYKFNSIKPTIVILQQSPKINLERLLKTLRPKVIVADGSNYKSYVSIWEKICLKNKTPFHSTMQKGAYVLW